MLPEPVDFQFIAPTEILKGMVVGGIELVFSENNKNVHERRRPSIQKQTLLYQRDMFELVSVQYIIDQETKPNMFTIVKFSNWTTAKIFIAGNKKYLTSKLEE